MDKILWIDLEMTGLDPDKEAIIEAAAIVTKAQTPFEELDHFQCVVRQHQEFIDNMDKWNSKVHKASGLLDLIPNGKTNEEAEAALLEFTQKHFKEPAVIAGNSISQDRAFIKKHFKKLEEKLHYRMLDVTAWKLIFEEQKISFDKKNRHRALSDIQESIEEMKFYLDYLDQEKFKKKT